MVKTFLNEGSWRSADPPNRPRSFHFKGEHCDSKASMTAQSKDLIPSRLPRAWLPSKQAVCSLAQGIDMRHRASR